MALARIPLSPSLLSPAAQRALAAGPARMMAARGLAPLPNPRDVLSVLYELLLDGDAGIQQAARGTADSLPERVLAGGLSDATLDPRVLDTFAELLANRPDMLERIIVNPSTAGATIAELTARSGAADIDLIAQNEQRLLASPEIIGAMFNNPHARMSTVDRAIELAARHNIAEIPGIADWAMLARAALTAKTNSAEAPVDDDSFASVIDAPTQAATTGAAAPAEAKEDDQGRMPNFANMSIPQKIRIATLGNKFVRTQLIRDSNKLVAAAVIKAPGVTDLEAGKYASNHSLSEDVIKYIANRRDWTKNYSIKRALILNPKTSIADAMRFIPHLRERDLRAVARSKGIASAVSTHAKKLLTNRGKKPKK